MRLIPAGPYWVDQYPTSRSLDDLVEPFRSGVRGFVDELVREGAQVHVSATRRPAERAWLMRGAWDVSRGLVRPDAVEPHDPPIPIGWTVEGARALAAAYGLAYRPSLTSRHLDGRAVDLTITGLPRATVERIGRKHKVYPLAGDPVHWSDDGR